MKIGFMEVFPSCTRVLYFPPFLPRRLDVCRNHTVPEQSFFVLRLAYEQRSFFSCSKRSFRY